MSKYHIKVRCRKGNDMNNQPLYDIHIYEASNHDNAIKMMYKHIWLKYGCDTPEVFELIKL